LDRLVFLYLLSGRREGLGPKYAAGLPVFEPQAVQQQVVLNVLDVHIAAERKQKRGPGIVLALFQHCQTEGHGAHLLHHGEIVTPQWQVPNGLGASAI
jgi:hypothetical protein